MATSSPTTTANEPRPSARHRGDEAGVQAMAAGALREAAAGIETVRAAATDVGERVPELIHAARSEATEGVRTIQTWPEPTQRTIAVFSAGLGVGLLVAGSPRLLVGGALLPALAIAASALGRETGGARRPA